VPDGEPTLDSNLSKEISLLEPMGIPIAVFTNASMLWSSDVRQGLLEADFVSLKLDAATNDSWRKIDRPNKMLELSSILEGVRDFTEHFRGTVVTETMLIDGLEDANEFEKIAGFLAGLKKLNRAYIAVPTKPPAEKRLKPAGKETVNVAFQVFSEKLGVDNVECLVGYEGNAFGFTGNIEEDLLSMMNVHPMRDEAIKAVLRRPVPIGKLWRNFWLPKNS
jgi:wyosine [tRNA(Phe)-imidazoG37] synthetase (radical SAM superfamily)